MDFPILYKGFERQTLVVRLGGIFAWRSFHLMHNGFFVEKKDDVYSVKNNLGQSVAIKLKGSLFDPLPKVSIGNDVIQLAPAFKWYEYVWIGFPILLITQGGMIGGAFGGLALFINGRIFRLKRGNLAKYGLSTAVIMGAIVGYLIAAVILNIILQKPS